MNENKWHIATTHDSILAALILLTYISFEIVVSFLLGGIKTPLIYYLITIPAAIVVALIFPVLGKGAMLDDFVDLCWYDVLVQVFGLVACLLHLSELWFWVLAHFIIVLKFARLIWPILCVNHDLPATWPVFGPVGYLRLYRAGTTVPRLAPQQRWQVLRFLLITAILAIGMQQSSSRSSIPIAEIVILFFTLRYTRRIMDKLAAREQQAIAAIEAAAQANADIAIANERLKNQAVIEAQNTALAEKNAALQTLSEQQAAVVKDLAERNQSLRDANHDLKQPINILRNRIDFALRLASNEEQIKLLNAVDLGMEELSLIMHGIVDQARASTLLSVPPMKAIALKDLANYCYMNYFALAQKHDMYFEQAEKPGELEGAVFCNEMLLKRILGNLLNNAILHGTPDGSIRLHFCRSGQNCRIWVSDNGKGIADANGRDHAANFTNLVEKLTQEQALFNAGQEALDGHRLGLMSVQRLCAELGVGMRLKSSPRFGTTFCFVVPLAACAPVVA